MDDFDLEKSEWRYLVTKTNTEHLVPLATQAVAILKDLHALTGQRRHVSPGRDPKKPMSDAAVNAALRRMGYDTRTEIRDTGSGPWRGPSFIKNWVSRRKSLSINWRTAFPTFWGQPTTGQSSSRNAAMMQQWADYLDKLKAGATVIPLHGQAASLESRRG